jgi:hypothetical protein
MNALREREINNNLERRLSEEQKLRGEFASGEAFAFELRLSRFISVLIASRQTRAIELPTFSLEPVARQAKNR